jgi:hypothetical protein
LWLHALEHAELLAQQQDLKVFVTVVATAHPDVIEQQRERLPEKQEAHGGSLAGTIPRSKEGHPTNRMGAPLNRSESLRRTFRTICAVPYAAALQQQELCSMRGADLLLLPVYAGAVCTTYQHHYGRYSVLHHGNKQIKV